MANEFQGIDAHSAEYFGHTRDHWWNPDFLEGVAKRAGFPDVSTVLDVGSGVGHWGRILSRHLPPTARITGVDREPRWVEAATARAKEARNPEQFEYRTGTAEALPFPDGTFDLTTCQTLLMHLRDPAAGLAEMVRVTRPGGLVLCAEPTNFFGCFLADALAIGDDTEEIAALLRFQLMCQRGKAAIGEGSDLLGEQVPALLVKAGLQDITARLNDRVNPLVAPYDSPAAVAAVEEMHDAAQRGMWIWNRHDTRRYFIGGGGLPEAFDALWDRAVAQRRRTAQALTEGTYASVGSGLFYVFTGRKPSP